MKRRSIILTILAVVLVLGLSVGSAWSYFTDTTTVEGSVALSVKPTTTITEENSPGNKNIRIQNTSAVVPVWVRARAYVPAALGGNASGTNWSGNITDWYEYGEPVAAGDETEALNVTYSLPGGYDPQTNTGAQNGDEYNIVVIYECVPVTYDADGNPQPANWNN